MIVQLTPARVARRAAARRAATAGALTALSTALTTGCYVQRPTPAPTPAGTTLVAVLNDQGRAELAPTIGSDVDRVEGRVLATTDSTVVLAMRSSRAFGGAETPWNGERVELRRSGARGYEQRALSRGRTIGVVVAAVGALVVLIATRTLNVGGQPEREPGERPPPGES